MEHNVISAIAKIIEMEFIFDLLTAIADKHAELLSHPDVTALAGTLSDYYFGGTWLADYELDECGKLPKSLKRGVLAEDGVYELLTNIGFVGK